MSAPRAFGNSLRTRRPVRGVGIAAVHEIAATRFVYTVYSKMASHDREIEIKLQIDDIAKLRAQLRKLHATSAPRVFERNTLYDTPAQALLSSNRLLRIRTETPARSRNSGPIRAILTYKAPVPGLPAPSLPPTARYKERQELEVSFQPAATLETILHSLGFHPNFRYEKFRTTYCLRQIKNLHLDLDETPIGTYLELEGSPRGIDRAAKLLGFLHENYITATYWDLYVAHCRGHNLTPTHLVFPRSEKNRHK